MSITEEIDDDRVEFYADGYSEEVEARAEECAHRVVHWGLNQEENEWRKECIFCPAVLETRPSKEAREEHDDEREHDHNHEDGENHAE